jgi:serine/threonine protein phosphatase 1
VVGDIHGCRHYLDRLLQLVDFDRSVDRLISVGDLVDRGPNSLGCLLLLKAPWFHAVMGNHEQLLLNFFGSWQGQDSPSDPYSESCLSFLMNGGDWALFESDSARRPVKPLSDLLPLVSALPQVLIVGEGNERYHVVHAELSKSKSRNGEPVVWSDAELDRLPEFGLDDGEFPGFRWSRKIMGSLRDLPRWPVSADGLSTTFCGHTVGHEVRRAYSHICLDTGAFVGCRDEQQAENYGLTLIDVKARRWFTVRNLSLAEGEL